MSSVITRHIINKNISVKSFYPGIHQNGFSQTCNYHSVLYGIERVKSYMQNVVGCKPGEKIILSLNWWPEYLHWFFACAELGIVMVVIDYPKSTNYRYLAKKLQLYGGIDYVVSDENNYKVTRFYNVGPTQPRYIFPEQVADHVFEDLNDQYFLNSDNWHAQHVLVDEDSPLIYTTSSGTTGTPKVISYSHKFFYDLMLRNVCLYDLKPTDKCMHTKLLHHGSVVGVYFLPTMHACELHYHTIDQAHYQEQLLDCEQIDRVLMFPAKLIDFRQVTQSEKVCIYTLAPLSDDYVQHTVGDCGHSVYSIFGCTETSGPLFLPSITPENYHCADQCNMGQPLDNFYQLSLNNNLLTVTMPDGSTVCTGDKFDIVDNNFIFQGRSNLYRIDDVKVDLGDLIQLVETHTGMKSQSYFDVVVDQAYNSIYLRSDSSVNLVDLNKYILSQTGIPQYCISYNLVYPRKYLVTGIKFNADLARLLCRDR